MEQGAGWTEPKNNQRGGRQDERSLPEESGKEKRHQKYKREFSKMEDGNRSVNIWIMRGLPVREKKRRIYI